MCTIHEANQYYIYYTKIKIYVYLYLCIHELYNINMNVFWQIVILNSYCIKSNETISLLLAHLRAELKTNSPTFRTEINLLVPCSNSRQLLNVANVSIIKNPIIDFNREHSRIQITIDLYEKLTLSLSLSHSPPLSHSLLIRQIRKTSFRCFLN